MFVAPEVALFVVEVGLRVAREKFGAQTATRRMAGGISEGRASLIHLKALSERGERADRRPGPRDRF